MGFYLYQSNNLQVLAEELAQRVNQPFMPNSLGDPLQQEIIVVPDRSMAHWVYLQLATANIIAPEAEMLFPGAFVYQYLFDPMMQHHTGATAEGELPFAPPTVTWRILALLPELEVHPGFESVAGFTQGDTFRRYQLATRLAELFDRYMTYRPDLLAAWELGQQPLSGSDATWQAELWQNLVGNNTLSPQHFSGLYQKFVAELELTTPPYLTKILQKRRIHYFGHPTLPPVHLDLLLRLSGLNNLDIHFFVVNPSQEEWSFAATLKKQLRDKIKLVELTTSELASNYLVTSNPLLGSLGRGGRDFFSLLLAYDELDTSNTHFVIPDSTTLLGKIQHQILCNIPPDNNWQYQSDDSSMIVHICHSPMREVEVLYDQLLHLFAYDPSLNPSDIAVYAPDMNKYAPYVDAVFGAAKRGYPGHLPYSIAHRTLSQEHQECQALIMLLEIASSRFKASEVMQLLEFDTIRNCFNIAEDEIELIVALLKHANLSWGLDSAAREEAGTAPTTTGTWRFALDRLILGSAMWDPDGSADPLTIDGNPLLPCTQGEGHADLISKIALLTERLEQLKHKFDGEVTGAEWKQRLEWVLDSFFVQHEQQPHGILAINNALADFGKHIEFAKCNTLLPLAIVTNWFGVALSGASSGMGAVDGRIVFSSFRPLSCAPVRIVTLLGMNDGTFPRQTPSLSFDLMGNHQATSLVGDRHTRDEDRYIFLLTLIAARERLIILYTGRSTVDNSQLPPAVLISELLDIVTATAGKDVCKNLSMDHRLQPFDYRYFQQSDAKSEPPILSSWSEDNYKLAQSMLHPVTTAKIEIEIIPVTKGTTPLPDHPTIITLQELQRFFRNPTKYFYNRVLGIRLEISSSDELSDDDMLELGVLDKYQLKQEMLDRIRQGKLVDPTSLAKRHHASGSLPTGHSETIVEFCEEINSISKEFRQLDPAKFNRVNLALMLESEISITAELELYDNSAYFHLIPSKIKPKYISDLWLAHLLLCATGIPVTSTLSGAETSPFIIGIIEQQEAHQQLQTLVNRFVEGQTRPLCFVPDIGWKLTHESKSMGLDDYWTGSDFRYPDAEECLWHAFGATLPPPESNAWQEMRKIAKELFQHPHLTTEK